MALAGQVLDNLLWKFSQLTAVQLQVRSVTSTPTSNGSIRTAWETLETHVDFKQTFITAQWGQRGNTRIENITGSQNSHLGPSWLHLFISQGFVHTWKQDTTPIQVHDNYKSKHLLGQCTINCTFLNKHYIYIYRVLYIIHGIMETSNWSLFIEEEAND